MPGTTWTEYGAPTTLGTACQYLFGLLQVQSNLRNRSLLGFFWLTIASCFCSLTNCLSKMLKPGNILDTKLTIARQIIIFTCMSGCILLICAEKAWHCSAARVLHISGEAKSMPVLVARDLFWLSNCACTTPKFCLQCFLWAWVLGPDDQGWHPGLQWLSTKDNYLEDVEPCIRRSQYTDEQQKYIPCRASSHCMC